MNVFEMIKGINAKSGKEPEELIAKFWEPFLVNKALSNTRDSVLFANEMNRWHNASKIWHYDFMYHGLPKKKRYGKWNKVTDDKKSIEIIMEVYDYSYARAKEVLPILKPRLKELKKQLNKGGRKK